MTPTVPLKRLVDPTRPITYGIVQAGEDVVGGVQYIRPVDMDGHRGVNPSALRTTSPDIAAAYARSSLKPGDVVVSIGPSFGKTMVVSEELDGANLTQGTARVAVRPGVHTRYIIWALQSQTSVDFWETSIGGATFRALNLGPLAETPIPVLAWNEQRAIADYLDRETARIDTLIEEQQRLIEILRERRAALISKETGWGATRPNGWHIMRLSWLFQVTGSGTTPANEDIIYGEDADVPWVTTGELRESLILRTARGVSFDVVERYSALKVHPAGSLLIAMYGATIGRMALLGVDATSNQACCALIGPTGVDPEFVQYSLMAAKGRLMLEAAGGGQPNINQDKIRSFRIPAPSLDEQRRVVAYLDDQTAKIDALIAESERFIELCRERRVALITAAVTGQSDMREVA